MDTYVLSIYCTSAANFGYVHSTNRSCELTGIPLAFKLQVAASLYMIFNAFVSISWSE